MAGMKFKVEADLEKLEKFKTKVSELKSEMEDMSRKTDPNKWREYEKELAKAESQMQTLTKQVQQAGIQMQDMGKGGAEGIQNVNTNLKQAITEQKQLIKEIKRDIDDLNSKSKDKSLSPSLRNEAKSDMEAAKKALAEEKGTLIGMQRKQIEMNSLEEASQGSLISKLGKWAAGIFSVTAAMELGKKVIESTETATQTFEEITSQASAATSFFFKTIASGDWSNFLDNIGKAVAGAREYVVAMEEINNKANEQKVKSSNLDIKIGEAYADSYSTDKVVQKKALQEIIKLNEEKYRGEAKIARETYEARVKKIAEDNGMNEKELENTIVYYTKRKHIIEEGERYNSLRQIVDANKGGNKNKNTSGIPNIATAMDASWAQEELNRIGKNGAYYGMVAQDFGKVTFPERDEVADLLSKANTAEAQINLNNKRIRMRLRALEMQEQSAADATAKAAQDERNRKSLEKVEYEREVGKRRIDTAFEIERQKIEIESDGYEKSGKLAELNYRQTLAAIEQRRSEMLQKQNEVSGGIDRKTGKKTKSYSSVLNPADQSQIDQLNANATLEYNTALHKGLLREFETFQQKRERIAKDYDAKILALASDPEAQGEARFQKQQAIDELDKQVAARSVIFSKWSKDLSKKTLDDLSGLLSSYEMMSSDLSRNGSLSDDERAVLREQIRALQTKIQELTSNGNIAKETKKDQSETLRAMNEINEAARNIILSFGEMDESSKAVFTSIANVTGGAINALMGIEKAGAAAFSALGAAEKASVVLGIMGAIVQVYNGISESIKTIAHSKDNQRTAERDEYLSLVDYNEELRQKYEWTKKVGEATLEYLRREGEELAKQGMTNTSTQDNLWSKLIGSKGYKVGQKTNMWNERVIDWRSLEGKTYDQISELSATGKLSSEAEAYYQALKKAKDEGKDILAMQEEYLQKLKETYTGTTADAIVSGIVDGFRAGKRGAADFASTFEDLMRNAMLSSLSLMSEDAVSKWYDEFYAASKDGLSKKELADLKKKWDAIIAEGDKNVKNLEAATGVSVTEGASPSTSGSSKSFSSMSQDTGNALDGRFTAVQIATEGTRDYVAMMDSKMGTMVDRQIDISDSARKTLEEFGMVRAIWIKALEYLENIAKYTKVLPQMADDIKSVKSNTDGLSKK